MKEPMIRVLKIEPHKEPQVIHIKNSLESLQKEVDGYLEIVVLSPTAMMVFNEEGKIIGLEGNRRFNNDVIVGNIIIAGIDDNRDTCSLSDVELKTYMERFKQPEEISQEEIDSTSTFNIRFF
jgi:hypothetical protein